MSPVQDAVTLAEQLLPYRRVERMGDATLYLGDCLEILPTLGKVDAVVTDPVWPNCPKGLLAGADDPSALLSEALAVCDADCIALVLGFDSDPRILSAVPVNWPFIRSQQLPYAMPGYRGRLLAGDEVAYVFGLIPRGRGVIPGRARTCTTARAARDVGHPCARTIEHMTCLVGWWSAPEAMVLDPFMGSGTTGVACANLGRKFIGCEIDEKYFDIACTRIEAAYKQQRLFP